MATTAVNHGEKPESNPGTSLMIDIAKVKADITKVEEDIAKVEQRIEEVEEQIKTASERALEALQGSNTPLFEYWRKEKEDLRKKEEDLRKEKEDLRKEKEKKEEDLRKKEEDLRKEKEDLRARLAAKEKLVERTAASNCWGPAHLPRAPGPSAQAAMEWIEAAAAEARPQRLDTQGMKKRIGRQGFDKAVLQALRDVKASGGLKQQSLALVLACASGVGKTYASLTVRSGYKRLAEGTEFEVVGAYMGFSTGMDMSPAEKEYLSSGGKTVVEKVVLHRLAMWLLAWKKWDLEVLDSEDDDVQMQVLLNCGCGVDHFKVLDVGELKSKIIDALKAIAKKTDKTLAVVAIVDEGQELDQLVKENGTPMGARLALRCLRELQASLLRSEGGKVILLPMCTGIDPETSLSDKTNGVNRVLWREDQVLLTPSDWRSFAVPKVQERWPKGTRRAVECFAGLAWPRARELIQALPSLELRPLSTTLGVREAGKMRELLKAAAEGTFLQHVPASMLRLEDERGLLSRPVLDWCIFKEIQLILRLDPLVFPIKPINIKELDHRDWHDFEGVAFRTIALFCGFFYHRARNDTTPLELPEGETTKQLRTWLPDGPAKFKCVRHLRHAAENLHPFTNHKLDDLSDQFREVLKDLDIVGTAILVHCGGNAPFDFIILKKLSDGLELRLADAKHTGKEDASASRAALVREHRELVEKGEKVHGQLKRLLLRADMGELVPFKPEHVLMVTNRVANDGTVIEGIVNPTSTVWIPMTHVLFTTAWPEQEEDI